MREVAVVTAGAAGIGLALGEALVTNGWQVVLADIDVDAARRHAERLTASGPGVAEAVRVDARDGQDVHRLVKQTSATYDRLDLMANVVGSGFLCEPEELTLEHWDWTIDINLRTVINGCQAAYPLMKAQGGGTILNVASGGGLGPTAGQLVPYATTKFAIVGLSMSLRSAGADYGVRVHALCPGNTDTPSLDVPWPHELPRPQGHVDAPTLRELAKQGNLKSLSPERVAQAALRGIEKGRPIIVLGWDARLPWLLARLSPRLGDLYANTVTRTVRSATRNARHV